MGGEAEKKPEKPREKDREKEEKDKEKKASAGKDAEPPRGKAEKDKGAPMAPPAAAPAKTALPPAAPAAPAKPVKAAPKPADTGLSDDTLTQVAQAKFDVQEDRLRDVARHTMTLLRDSGKMGEADFSRKVTDIQKVLLKYETQYIRAWEYQERRRRREVEDLEKEVARCGKEAEVEGERIVELRETLEQEKKRRKRYERYEELAEAVCRKASRTEQKADIAACRDEIVETRRRRAEVEDFVVQRQMRAQLLSHAVAELRGDLKKEQTLCGEAGVAGAPAPGPEPAASPDQVEVIS